MGLTRLTIKVQAGLHFLGLWERICVNFPNFHPTTHAPSISKASNAWWNLSHAASL